MSLYPFHALLGRMKYITRWALMRCMRQESLSEHTADTALLAHAPLPDRPEHHPHRGRYPPRHRGRRGAVPRCAGNFDRRYAYPGQIQNEALRTAYKAVERESALAMADLLPPELHEIEGSYLTGSVLNDAERKLLKAADRLSALIKCMEEVESGNREFTAALAQQKADLAAMHSPEADYFIEHMLPCYTQNLDELTKK